MTKPGRPLCGSARKWLKLGRAETMTEILVLALFVCVPHADAANSGAGTSGAQFLKIGAGSRAGAMAEAYAALGDDAYALYHNPAAATLIREPQLGAAHTSYFQGANYEVGSFAYPLRSGREEDYSRHVLGFSLYNLSVADIERRGTTETNAALGTFGAGDYSYNLSYAYRLDRRLGLGVTGKLIHQTIDAYKASAYAMDAGAHWTPRPESARPFSYAAVVKNVGTRPSFAGGISDPLPLGATLGAGWQAVPKVFRVELDLTKYRDTDPFVAAGAEYVKSFGEGVTGAIRGGYTSHYRDTSGFAGATMGLGIGFHRAAFDFAWIPYGELGNTFRYSLLIKFGGKQ